MQNKVLLMILDGWGIAENPKVSAIDAAQPRNYLKWLKEKPNTTLRASEEWVGLPKGQVGNSEVGHLSIGAGRIVFQELDRISNNLSSGEVKLNPVYQELVAYCLTNNKPLHLSGLVSDGGVHSHITHLECLVDLFSEEGIAEIYIHVITDGRDTDPESGLQFIRRLQKHISKTGIAKIASVCGRYYTMDRDKRWERIKKGYDLMVFGKGKEATSPELAIQESYAEGITDEFIAPVCIHENGKAIATIKNEDAFLFFNFRSDRAREITRVLSQSAELDMKPLALHFVCMSPYEKTFTRVEILFNKDNISNGLGQVLADAGKKQMRIAETEKYPHVTFFFNGGREAPYPLEERIMCPSPKVSTYDLKPEMSAAEIQDSIIPVLKKGIVDFICLNFANPDMVGHTGVWDAAVKACKVVDECAGKVAEAALENGYTVLVTADHGNSDKMKNEDGSPNTSHTIALVPLILLENSEKLFLRKSEGKLGDLAPTILNLMGIPVPQEMTGESLLLNQIELIQK